jgi:hypothetical protein
MSQSPYRTAERIPTQRRLEADATIHAWDERIGSLQLVFLSADLRKRIERLRATGSDSDDDSRVALADALDEAVESLKTRTLELRKPPETYPRGPTLEDLWGPIGTESAARPVLRDVESAAHQYDRNAHVTLTGPRITARLSHHGSPILWSLHLGSGLNLRPQDEVECFLTGSHWMGTSVSAGIPRLFLRAEGITDTVFKALHLRSEIHVGDEAFDDAFFLEGAAEFARVLFTQELRRAFFERARFGRFSFLLHGGVGSLKWTTSFATDHIDEKIFGASVTILRALRTSLREIRLIDGETSANVEHG